MHGVLHKSIALRKVIFAVPFGCLAAIAAHFVRFGDEHAFGGSGNEGLVSAALAGALAAAVVILHGFLTGGSTLADGTVAAQRMRALIPGAPALFSIAAFVYYGIETLEGNGIEVGWPTLVIAIFSLVFAYALRGVAALVAHFVADIISDWLALLDRRGPLVCHAAARPVPIRSQVALGARRLGRAPPNGRLFR